MIWRSSLNSWLARVADFVTVYLSLGIAYLLWLKLGEVPSASVDLLQYLIHIQAPIAFSVVVVIVLNDSGAYSYQRFTSIITELLMVARAAILTLIITVVLFYFTGKINIPRAFFVFSFVAVFGFVSAQKILMYYIVGTLRAAGTNRKRILVIGTDSRAEKFIEVVQEHFDWGLDVVGFLTADVEKVGKSFYGFKVLNTFDQIEHILRTVNPEEVIITISTKQFDQVRNVMETCEREGVQVRLNSDFFGHITKKVRIDNVYGLNIISFSTLRISEFQLVLKRLVDIAGALVALVIFSPFMIMAALGILITDGLPIFYEWNVYGLNKKPFRSWKFRTMVRNADDLKESLMDMNEMDGPVFKITNDPRIFPFGKWLRKWSIDETPQLFSVITGDMSLVGPRPAGIAELQRYESWHRRKLSIKPGITCLWQVNGRNHIKNFDEWIRLDLEYIDNWSVWLDIQILLKTVQAVVTHKGAS
ncbi:MAG: sugar transferase [Bacteroidota bacterium]